VKKGIPPAPRLPPHETLVFIMLLAHPGGEQPPYTEPMETLEACLAKVAETHKSFLEHNETFRFTAGCIQNSAKLPGA
jgi:hypothetical protein